MEMEKAAGWPPFLVSGKPFGDWGGAAKALPLPSPTAVKLTIPSGSNSPPPLAGGGRGAGIAATFRNVSNVTLPPSGYSAGTVAASAFL